MPELTELISLDNWRKIKPIAVEQVLDERVYTAQTDMRGKSVVLLYNGWDKQLVPPIHEIQVDPVSPAFEMWHDAEERN